MAASSTTMGQLDQLPHHILSDILERVVHSDHPHCRTNILRVCSAFYLSAIPFIYRSPRISSHLSSFFLHSEIDPPTGFQIYSSGELVRAGHLKLAALRYVQHLQFGDPEWYKADTDPDLQMSDTQKFVQEHLGDLSRKNDRSNALASVRDLPDGSMPRLRAVQVGEISYEWARSEKAVPAGAIMKATQFAACLLERTTPKIWCIRPRTSAPLILPIRPLGSAMVPEDSDLTFHIHVHACDDFDIVPGGTTYIHIHQDSRKKHLIPGFNLQVSWIAQQIQRSFQEQDLRDPAVIARSRIYILGIMGETAAGAQIVFPQNQPRDNIARGIFQSAVKGFLKQRSEGKLQNLSIEVWGTEDTQPCPGCGRRV